LPFDGLLEGFWILDLCASSCQKRQLLKQVVLSFERAFGVVTSQQFLQEKEGDFKSVRNLLI
jgi:hypothetical protein